MELVFTVQKVEYRVSPHYHCIDRQIYSEQKITSWSGNPVYNSQLPHVLERKISKENSATGSLSHKHTHTLITALVRIAATHTHTHSIRARSRKHTHFHMSDSNEHVNLEASKKLYKRNYTNEKFLQPHMQDLHTQTKLSRTSVCICKFVHKYTSHRSLRNAKV